MRIGELAAIAGVSTRAVRHYHAIGVLPEPKRRPNGYREYTAADLLRLLKVTRMAALGLSLDEIRDVLTDGSGTELRDILAEIAADLSNQAAQLQRQRDRIADAVESDAGLVSTPEIAALVAQIRDATHNPNLAAQEEEMLALFQATIPAAQFNEIVGGYGKMLADPAVVAQAELLADRFALLTNESADDGEVVALADEIAALGSGMFSRGGVEGHGGRAWDLFLDSLSPAQRSCVELAARRWQE